MNTKLELAIEAAGWKSGEVGDFFEMTEEERRLVDVAKLEYVRADATPLTLPARCVEHARSTPGPA